METKFTEKESLAIITEMITQARNNIQKGSGTGLIFWGYYVAFTALMNVVLIYLLPNPNQSFWIWWLMPFGWIVDYFIDKKVDKEAIVKTHIDKIISTTWKSFGCTIVLFLLLIFASAYLFKDSKVFVLITPVIMLMTGMAEFITSKVCRFKPFFYGAVVMWLGAVACIAAKFVMGFKLGGILQFIILAICIIIAFVVPGHQLNKKAKDHV